jgi:uncharacterized protein (DUF1501 family)
MKRQEFIKQLGLLSGGTVFSFAGIRLNAMPSNPFGINIENTEGKILVLLQLQGGNDGLNTVIPIEDAKYYTARKTINIKKEEAIKINNTLGFHPSMAGLKGLFDENKLSVIQNVGYADPDRSHFRSTDIWLSASDAKQNIYDGWVARYLENQNPTYPGTLPAEPMAIQLGSVESMLLQGKFGSLGTVFEDPNLFYQLISGSKLDNDPPPATIAGNELKFLRQVAAASIQYSEAIKTKADKGKNIITYPNTNLGRQLSIVSKLISGGLNTPIYLTTINGFDTHANQLAQHSNLWKQVSEAITAFQKDIEALGISEKVTLMTFSEFGRRVNENGTNGTDHGSAAPLFVIGKTVKGGIMGSNPNLNSLDANGDIKFEFDFRQIYSTILSDHLSNNKENVMAVLLKDFNKLPIFRNNNNLESNSSIGISQNYPNPAVEITNFDYFTSISQHLTLKVIDLQGREIAILKNEIHPIGSFKAYFNVKDLPQGIYAYSLIATNGELKTMKMIVAK